MTGTRFERTGEYRKPEPGEWYENIGRNYGGDFVNRPEKHEPSCAPQAFKAWILREVEEPLVGRSTETLRQWCDELMRRDCAYEWLMDWCEKNPNGSLSAAQILPILAHEAHGRTRT